MHKRLIGRPRPRGEDNIKTELRKVELEGMHCIKINNLR
jgi:hypothetical protein